MRQEQPAELDRLDRRFRSALTAFFARRIRNRAEAEDLTQEVFTRLARHPRESGETPDAYVFSVAANLLSDRSRREIVSRRYRESESLPDDSRGVDRLDPFRIAAGRQELAQLARAIAELPEKTRRIFILYRIENIDKPAIAASFGLSTRMIEIHIRRALEALAARREQEL